MTLPIGIAILLGAGISLIITSGFIFYAMIGKVNRKLPDNEQIGYIGFYPAKVFRITAEYRRLYPHSHLNAVRILLSVVGFILGACAAARLSHFWR
jgi:hypothetical protein